MAGPEDDKAQEAVERINKELGTDYEVLDTSEEDS